jgi:DNA-binding NarL/FixJ family response regulator
MNKIKVFIADDHKILRESLIILLSRDENIEVIGEAADGQEAFGKICSSSPDVAVLDISLPGLNGLDLAAKLHQEAPNVKIVILTMHKSEDFVARALFAGVKGYVLKENALEELIQSIRKVHEGGMFLSNTITELVVNTYMKESQTGLHDDTKSMSTREREILQLLAEGYNNKDVSEKLNLSVKTVETHRANIMRKMEFKNVTELVLYAVRNHMVQP